MDNIRNYLTPIGAPPWAFKGEAQPYITPVTKKSLPLGNSSAGRSWEKKFENMRGRPSIGFELSADCLLYTSPSPRDRTRSRMPSSA